MTKKNNPRQVDPPDEEAERELVEYLGHRCVRVLMLPATLLAVEMALVVVIALILSARHLESEPPPAIPSDMPPAAPPVCRVVLLADATLASKPQETNGDLPHLRVANHGNNLQRALLRFQIDGLAGRTVKQAELRLAVAEPPQGTQSFRITLVDGSWEEATVQSIIPPAEGQMLGAHVDDDQPPGAELVVQLDPEPIKADGRFDLYIVPVGNPVNYIFHAREAGLAVAPRLILTLADGSQSQPPAAPE